MLSKCLLDRCPVVGASDKPNPPPFSIPPGGCALNPIPLRLEPGSQTILELEAYSSPWPPASTDKRDNTLAQFLQGGQAQIRAQGETPRARVLSGAPSNLETLGPQKG